MKVHLAQPRYRVEDPFPASSVVIGFVDSTWEALFSLKSVWGKDVGSWGEWEDRRKRELEFLCKINNTVLKNKNKK